MPSDFSFAETNASIGLANPDGAVGREIGFRDHHAPSIFFGGSRGSGAPRLIHSSKSATSAGGSGFFGGILRSGSVRRIAFTSKLFSGSPGTITGPNSPPACQPLRESRVSPPFILPD